MLLCQGQHTVCYTRLDEKCRKCTQGAEREEVMETMEIKRQLEVGDIIKCQGITARIAEIAFQEPWQWRNSYYLEFRDTNGEYRSWKQEYDGGTAFDKDGNRI